MAAGGLARVLDLGSARPRRRPGDVEVVRAGKMLTAVGGYPSTRPWAAGGLFREVADDEVDAAVAEQVAAGAAVIKIALNVDAGPVWPDETLAAVVAAPRMRRAGRSSPTSRAAGRPPARPPPGSTRSPTPRSPSASTTP